MVDDYYCSTMYCKYEAEARVVRAILQESCSTVRTVLANWNVTSAHVSATKHIVHTPGLLVNQWARSFGSEASG